MIWRHLPPCHPRFHDPGRRPDGTEWHSGYEIKGEFSQNGFKNDLKHSKGVFIHGKNYDPRILPVPIFHHAQESPHLDLALMPFGKVMMVWMLSIKLQKQQLIT